MVFSIFSAIRRRLPTSKNLFRSSAPGKKLSRSHSRSAKRSHSDPAAAAPRIASEYSRSNPKLTAGDDDDEMIEETHHTLSLVRTPPEMVSFLPRIEIPSPSLEISLPLWSPPVSLRSVNLNRAVAEGLVGGGGDEVWSFHCQQRHDHHQYEHQHKHRGRESQLSRSPAQRRRERPIMLAERMMQRDEIRQHSIGGADERVWDDTKRSWQRHAEAAKGRVGSGGGQRRIVGMKEAWWVSY